MRDSAHEPICIVSGGQTGVDRTALDVAIELGLPHGGWCPRGRRAEDGPIAEDYELRETESSEYHVRTEQNVIDSDATLVLTRGEPVGGTALTIRFAHKHARPLLVVDLARSDTSPADGRDWIITGGYHVLNVAGPRESQQPGIAKEAAEFLRSVLLEFRLLPGNDHATA
jgi:hypothetical protein